MPLLASLGIISAKGYGFTQGPTNGPPINTVAPVNSYASPAKVGDSIGSSIGTWISPGTSGSLSYARQWCIGTTSSPTIISGATSGSFTITTAELGQTVFCRITATNSIGSTVAYTNSTNNVQANVPTAPTIGTATATGATTATVAYTASSSNQGATITSYTAVSSPGGITGSLSTAGSGTITVSGLSSGTSYTFTVYATNSIGNSASSSSSNSITTTAVAPTNTVAPAITSGTPQFNSGYVTVNTGTWANTPTSYSYQWYQSTDNILISGATSSSLAIPSSSYVGKTLRCLVTASNSAGSNSAYSNNTAAVLPNVPFATNVSSATATGYSTATVVFTAPSDNGGATITQYNCYDQNNILRGTLNQSAGGTFYLTNLSASTTYIFTVKATNSVGQGPAGSSGICTTSAPVQSVAISNSTIPFVYPWSDSTGFGAKFADPSPTTGGFGAAHAKFHPAGNYIGFDTFAGNNFDVYAWSNSTGWGTKSAAPATIPANYGYAFNWSAQGTSLCVGSSGSPYIQAYPFSSGTVGTKWANPSTLPGSGGPTGVAFSIAGTELVMITDTSPYLYAYSFSSSSGFGAKLTNPTLGSQARGISFSPAGTTLGLAGYMSGGAAMYPWSSSGFGSVYSNTYEISSLGFSVDFNPDSDNVVFGSYASPYVQAFRWTTASGFGTKYSNPATVPTSYAAGIAFSKTGTSVVAGLNATPYVAAYPFSKGQAPVYGTGWGTKFSNPATLPIAAATDVSFSAT